MNVVRTDNWIVESSGDPSLVCKHLTEFFPSASAEEIHHHLTKFGMYVSVKQGRKLVPKLVVNNVWEIVEDELEHLQEEWKGPSIPVFIFPSNSDNEELLREFNGKSGLSYVDKLFLFVSPANSETEIRALVTHEYNHVCRLNKFPKQEQEYTLLDTIILEGLAEMAVEESFGKTYTSLWTSLYSEKQVVKLWNDYILPNRHYSIASRVHEEILYGLGDYPHMAGYCVGYDVVRNFLRYSGLQVRDLVALPSTEIARLPEL
jgi:uncharacterized protein YjaZ